MRTTIKKYSIITSITNVIGKKWLYYVKKRQPYNSEGFSPDILFISLAR